VGGAVDVCVAVVPDVGVTLRAKRSPNFFEVPAWASGAEVIVEESRIVAHISEALGSSRQLPELIFIVAATDANSND
jgi:hypothetical protein